MEIGMRRPVPILLYHSVDERECAPGYRRWNVPPETFDRHMGLLAGAGYHPVTVSALMEWRKAGRSVPERTVLITFDDGLRDFMTGALPILDRHGFPATLYVVSGLLGKTSLWLAPLGEGGRAMLSESELRQVADHNVEIGAHTHTHPQLDLLPAGKARDEIFRCKAILEDVLSRPVLSFAYPHGYASNATRALVRSAGYTSACRVRNALSDSSEDRFALARIIISPDLSDEAFLGLVRGARLDVAPPLESIPIKGWRLVRRMRKFAGLSP
jgi:peptidoglycan/xylan/chitin deacetylase (PgdA/CDA1 family)